jgi:hypothetical protein
LVYRLVNGGGAVLAATVPVGLDVDGRPVAERGVKVDHVTIYRSVQRFTLRP